MMETLRTAQMQPPGRSLMSSLRRRGPFVIYVALHLLAVAGLVSQRYPDSATYMILSFSGSAPQLPTVPIVYEIFRTDTLRLLAQACFAACCWWFLAATVAALLEHWRVRLGAKL